MFESRYKPLTRPLHADADAWPQVLDPDIVKGLWRKEEDDTLRELIAIHGAKNWTFISSYLPGRLGKQCRERCAPIAECSGDPRR